MTEQKKQKIPLFEQIMRGVIAGTGISTVFLSVIIVSLSLLTKKPDVKVYKPAIYEAIPEGKEGYYRLITDNLSLIPGQTFDVKIILENTTNLNVNHDSGTGGYGEGIAWATIKIVFNPARLRAVDMNTSQNGIQALSGNIFNYTKTNSIDNASGVALIEQKSDPGTPEYPYNSYDINGNNKSDNDKLYATIRFTVIATNDTSTAVTIEGNDSHDDTNLLTNIQNFLTTDILNQSLADNNGNLELTISEAGSPTATPTPPGPTNTPPPPTPTPTPGGCDNGLKLEYGDLNQDCIVNNMDWTIMWKNWTSY